MPTFGYKYGCKLQDRIALILEKENLKAAEFAEKIGVKRGTISHLMSGRNKLSSATLELIIKAFPRISPSWLLMGKGEMYNGEKQPEQTTLFGKESIHPEEPIVRKATSTRISSGDGSTKNPMPGMPPVFAGEKKIMKIVVFYTDNTFDEFCPQ